ncbi:hypothetical protein GCM10011405_27440 [Rufibacter glacialis]|nr:hypothetical protein GCM10011405_27440 [Rufibacter glacialis]
MNTEINKQTSSPGKIRNALFNRKLNGSGFAIMLFVTNKPLKKKKNFTANEPE